MYSVLIGTLKSERFELSYYSRRDICRPMSCHRVLFFVATWAAVSISNLATFIEHEPKCRPRCLQIEIQIQTAHRLHLSDQPAPKFGFMLNCMLLIIRSDWQYCDGYRSCGTSRAFEVRPCHAAADCIRTVPRSAESSWTDAPLSTLPSRIVTYRRNEQTHHDTYRWHEGSEYIVDAQSHSYIRWKMCNCHFV